MTSSPSSRKKKNPKGRRVGLVIVHTGNGKGKTTAALGTAMRAVGVGYRVRVIQFIKGSWDYGELHSAQKLGIEVIPMGEGFTWETKNRERDTEVARKTWEACRATIEANQHDLVILDEINNTISYGYLDIRPVLDVLRARPKDMHVILTGRDAHPDLIAYADLVTEMREIKHPFHRGIYAQRGIEY